MLRSRKWSRFKIGSEKTIKARILEGLDRSSALNSIGMGGCSFMTGWRDAHLLQRPQVRVELRIGNESLLVDGIVHYCRFLPDRSGNIVGIEFKWSDEEVRKSFGNLIGKAVIEGNLEHMQSVEV